MDVPPGKRKAAFTLIEIMIVVSIIGLVAVLALPSFAKARQTSIRNKCINNMRAIYDGTVRYEIDHNSTLFSIRSDGVAIRNTLVNGGYVKSQGNFDCPSSATKDFDDYQLVYRANQELSGVSCDLLPSDHILP